MTNEKQEQTIADKLDVIIELLKAQQKALEDQNSMQAKLMKLRGYV
jgi:hypothetical protein